MSKKAENEVIKFHKDLIKKLESIIEIDKFTKEDTIEEVLGFCQNEIFRYELESCQEDADHH